MILSSSSVHGSLHSEGSRWFNHLVLHCEMTQSECLKESVTPPKKKCYTNLLSCSVGSRHLESSEKFVTLTDVVVLILTLILENV